MSNREERIGVTREMGEMADLVVVNWYDLGVASGRSGPIGDMSRASWRYFRDGRYTL